MSLLSLCSYRRGMACGLLVLFLSMVIDIPAFAQGQSSREVRGTNIKWALKENLIVITYDLNGSSEDTYDVSIALRNERDSSFSIIPATVEGDIGAGQFAGVEREIRWYFRKDFPQGFQGEGYYFEIFVKPIQQKSNLLYYVVGGAAVTVGIVALLLGTSSPERPPPTLYLPGPPVRP